MNAGVGGPGGAPPADMAAQHKAVATGPNDVKVQKVAKATGADARSVEEIWAQRDKLKGKPVTVRGQVVKFTPVMGKNFLHLRDGTGAADKNNNDVTVTTSDTAAIGDVVTAKGTVIVDKDFGAGYAYPVLIDDAKVTK
jgi:aspartyl/asparaginyl-tRNA synthetase